MWKGVGLAFGGPEQRVVGEPDEAYQIRNAAGKTVVPRGINAVIHQ
jgi:hypothetical protein